MSNPDGEQQEGTGIDYHVPVLAEQVPHHLITDPRGLYVDATLGGGGHARRILERLEAPGRLLGIDRDPEALAACEPLQQSHPRTFTRVRGDFRQLEALLAEHGGEALQGLLLDLGVSSRQLDRGERGFSFLRDGPLDMRMGQEDGPSAAELVNQAPEDELRRLFRELGEEPRAGRAAAAIVRARRRAPLETTGQLADLLEKALGRRGPKHPGTRVFQALRMAVNRELEALEAVLASLPGVLAVGGRIVVIAYHSLEDRRVKQAFRELEPHCRCPKRALRCTCGHPGSLRILTRRVVRPDAAEVAANPRARSARLRAAERLVET